MNRIVITGSSGYLGSKLVPKLTKQGQEVLGIDVAAPAFHDVTSEFQFADICDPKLLDVIRVFRPDTIIYAAFGDRHAIRHIALRIRA